MTTKKDELLEFLISQSGGRDTVENNFRKHILSKMLDGRTMQNVTLQEVIAAAAEHGWGDWIQSISLLDLYGIVRSAPSPIPKTQLPKLSQPTSGKLISQERIDRLMKALETAHWMDRRGVSTVVGLPMLHDVNLLLRFLTERGSLKQHRGKRNTYFALAYENTPPPGDEP